MMANKDHESYIKCIKNISSITTVDIPNQPNAISGKKLKDKFNHLPNVKYAESIEKAIKSMQIKSRRLINNYWITLFMFRSFKLKLDIFF